MTASNLIEAYESMDHEIVEEGNLSLPMSTPAVFNYKGTRPDLTAEQIESRLKGEDYAFVDVYTEERDGKVYVSGKVYDAPANISYKFKIRSQSVCIFPDPEIPFSAFKRFVSHIEDRMGVELAPAVPDTDS